jgi:Fe-S-cluster-containing hydrogenase component 2
MVDEEACNGCAWCISACQFGAMMIHPERKVALTFVTAQTLAQKSRIDAVKNLFQEAKEKKATAK